MASISSALIVGGGIAGLSAAIGLARAGVRCEVVEAADGALGASLGISGRAAEALDELGVYDECYASGTPFTRDTTALHIMNAEGRILSTGPQRPDWPGAKTAVGIYRPVLIKILADTATRLGVEIRKRVAGRSIEEHDDKDWVTFSDGEKRNYDFVVGADGISSSTRESLFPDAPKPAYSGQMSLRWMAPGPPIKGEGWYVGPVGRLGFYHLPEGIYVPAVISAREWERMSDGQVFSLFTRLLDSYSAPAVVELRQRLTEESNVICRPFDWILLNRPWYNGRTLLIGDAAHATTAHMGMGGGMALEDGVVLGQSIAGASTLTEALDAFMTRRLARVSTVVETSVALSRLEQQNAPPSENVALLSTAFKAIAQPY